MKTVLTVGDTHINDTQSLSRFLMALRGYAWDGSSWPAIDGKTNLTPSLFHDAAYQLVIVAGSRCRLV